MPADITSFESRRVSSMITNNMSAQVFTLPKLIEYSRKKKQDDPTGINFMPGYLPEVKYKDVESLSDIFLCTSAKTFNIDGAQCIRYILLDKRGNIYEDLDLWTQVLPFSFLARVSCSYRNFSPDSLSLDYFIDLTDIQLATETDAETNSIIVKDKEITNDYASRGDKLIKIDDRIASFNQYRKEVFADFFKYDFGNAIKSISKDY